MVLAKEAIAMKAFEKAKFFLIEHTKYTILCIGGLEPCPSKSD